MCFAEEIQYRCGHYSLPVVRPCPMTTSGHNNPICQIQQTNEYIAETMCVACERVLHSRWTLLQEFEHRWYHERGVCQCEVIFPALDDSPRVIGARTKSPGRSDDESTLAETPSTSPGDKLEMGQHDGQQSKGDRSDNINITLVQDHTKNPSTIESMHLQGRRTHIPALYEERRDNDKTLVTVRQPSQYAAEWLLDHRAVHAAGRCTCRVDTKQVKNDIRSNMTADEEKVISLHHQITGEGHNLEHWTPPTKHAVERWRKETNVPELGTRPAYTVKVRRAADSIKYPVPLGNNMYLTEGFVVWDSNELAARVESMRITSNNNGRGGASSVRVPNGVMQSPQEAVYHRQPNVNGPSRETRKKGQRRPSGRHWTRRDTMTSSSTADPFVYGSPDTMLYGWHQQGQSMPSNDQNWLALYNSQMQQSMESDAYGYLVPQQQHPGTYDMRPTPPSQHSSSAAQDRESQRHVRITSPMRTEPEAQQENLPHVSVPNMPPTPPPEHGQTTPPVIHRIEGAGNLIGWYVTPLDTQTDSVKSTNGNSVQISAGGKRNVNQTTPTKTRRSISQPAVQHPAALATASRLSPIQSGISNNDSSGKSAGKNTTSGSSTSAAATTPSRSSHKRGKTAAQKLRRKQKKEEEQRQKQLAAATNGDNNNKDDSQQQRDKVVPLLGLPSGAGPESSRPHMPAFSDCSLFTPVLSKDGNKWRSVSCSRVQDS